MILYSVSAQCVLQPGFLLKVASLLKTTLSSKIAAPAITANLKTVEGEIGFMREFSKCIVKLLSLLSQTPYYITTINSVP